MDKTTYKMKHPLLITFFTAFFMFLVSFLPILIISGGRYLYSGDYNIQTVAFLEHISQIIHSDDPLPLYDWESSLGMNFLNAYGGYSTSPFSLMLYLFPVNLVKYAHTFVAALKMGITALGAYIYCRQYVKQDRSAFICGILYAFSGFQLFSMVYPFIDSIALFPLMLYAFDQLMTKRRSVWFAVMVFINGAFNTYFLWQACVFILVYFLVRVCMKTYPGFDLKLFLKLAFESLVGVGLTAVGMFPGLIGVSGNSRAGKLIFSTNLLSYETPGVLLKAVQSMFFPPDDCGIPWYFTDRKMALDPPVLFIPFFFVIGVALVMKRDKKSWYTRLMIVCAGILAVPVLNSVFSAFNYNFYARWLYMPILIMVMMTGMFVDDIDKFNVDKALSITGIAVCVEILWGLYCVYFMKKTSSASILWRMDVAVVILSFITLYIMFHPTSKLKFISLRSVHIITCVFSALFFFVSAAYIMQANYFEAIPDDVQRLWNDDVEIDLPDDQFYRVTTAALNDSLTYGIPDIDFFNSMCTGDETNFYSRVGSVRLQNTNLTEKDYALYTFLSARYNLVFNPLFLDEFKVKPENISRQLKGYENYKEYNWYVAFENKAFIPMGYTFDYYLNVYDFKPEFGETKSNDAGDIDMDDIMEQIMKATSAESVEEDEYADPDGYKFTEVYKNEKLLLKAIWLTDAQIKKYGDILEELPDELAEDVSYETYLKDCEERAAHACYEFNPDGKGFSAKIDLEKDNLVFFSIPYDKGFTAYVDGQETEIEKVFDGLSAVFVPKGDHSIRFDYRILGLKEGGIVSIVCAVLFLIYIFGCAALYFARKKHGTADAAVETGTETAQAAAATAPETEPEEGSDDHGEQKKE